MSILMLQTSSLKSLSAEDFFNDVLPKALTHQEEIAKKLGGVFTFALFGQGGGQWCINLDSPCVEALDDMQGLTTTVDLHLEMNTSDFESLLKGDLDVEKAAQEGTLRLRGDLAKMEALAILFDVPEV